MRKTEELVLWVVYRKVVHKVSLGGVAICEQTEWDEMQRTQTCAHLLIEEGIESEVAAEKLARSQPGVTPPPKTRFMPRV
jgi:hypothetical protein